MAFEKSLYEFDAGYFEYIPGLWLPGKTIPDSTFGCMSKKAVDEAINVELDDFDVLLGTYPKTGKCISSFGLNTEIKQGYILETGLRLFWLNAVLVTLHIFHILCYHWGIHPMS